MALLTPSLRDRARVLRTVSYGPRIEGRRANEAVSGEWFPCRVVAAPSVEVEAEGRRRIAERAELICTVEDVWTSDRIEVRSARVGDGTWRVAGRPQVASTRRPHRAVLVPLERLVEGPPPDDVLP